MLHIFWHPTSNKMKAILCIWLICQVVFGFPIEDNAQLELNADKLDGDIIFSPEQRNGIKNTTFRWVNAHVPFVLDEDYTAAQRKVIEEAMKMFHDNTCVRFAWRNPEEKDYIYINNDNGLCSSPVGRRGGKQPLNLGNICIGGGAGIVAHELAHAIGFYHEHNRTDRDEYVIIEWDNIKANNSQWFKVQTANQINTFGQPYDYASITHYGPTAFSKNGQPTIIPVDSDVEIGQRRYLSDIDIKKINLMYKCP